MHLRLRSELDDGRAVDVFPTKFEPLSVHDLWELKENANVGLKFKFTGQYSIVDTQQIYKDFNGSITINFLIPPQPYALVAGGWLPLPFVRSLRFLVDRNVVSNLKRIRENGQKENDATYESFKEIFKDGSLIFNPLLYAYEGAKRRLPTRSEFDQVYEEGRLELLEAFPRSTVIEFDELHAKAAYQQLTDLAARGERDTKLLIEVAPLIAHRVSRKMEKNVRDKIIEIAIKNGVQPYSPVCLACFSALYDDVNGKTASIGRKLLKPKPNYTGADAYNAISDLRHIELAAASNAVLDNEPFALCTADQGLAEFWSALEIQGESTPENLLQLHYCLSTALLPRLMQKEINELAEILQLPQT